MKRLSSVDAALWFAETRGHPIIGGGLRICDPSEAPNFSFDAVRDHLAARIQELPALRYRVAGAKLGLDKPWFVEDPTLDLDFHVRRAVVRSPGGRRERDELVGRLMSYPLDLARPLWQKWFIEGLEHGRVATLMKVHHALVDGASGAELFEFMYDTSPEPRLPVEQASRSSAGRGVPRFERRALGAILNIAMTPYRVLRFVQQTLSRRWAMRGIANRPPHFFQAPITRFNAPVSPHRRVSSSRLQLDRINAVKRAFGVTLNDVVLAVVSAALRRYLQDRGELPERPLVAQMGISTRGESRDVGNQIIAMRVGLATDVTDPAERMKTIFANTQGVKEMAKAVTEHQIVGLTEIFPPGVFALGARAYNASHLGSHIPPINVVISNTSGAAFPLYLVGAIVEQAVPYGPLVGDVGLNITCFSNDGWVDFGFVTTPEIANDIDELADAIEPAIRELEVAAGWE